MLREIDERRRAEEKLQHQAQYDGLTDLPNRLLAIDRLSQAIRAAERTQGHVVLIFLDLDDFKKVNDTLGHQHGDALLMQAARRLRQAVRAEDTVARHGGDEFLVIIGGLKSPEDAEAVAEKIVRAFADSFDLGGSEVVVTPSMGLAVYPDDGDSPSMLLRNADLAMYDAKDAGRNTYRYFNQQVHDSSVHRLTVERRLRSALPRDEFRLVYQLPPGCLQIEVTEGLLIRNQPEVRETLMALSALGVRLAMDDFGTGYSSLSYLKRFPFDALKIDREFVRDLASDPDDRALVTAAIRMGKGLGLSVVAEGVETDTQLAILAEQECDLVRGYLFSKPLPPEEFAARWLRQGVPATAHWFSAGPPKAGAGQQHKQSEVPLKQRAGHGFPGPRRGAPRGQERSDWGA